MPRCWRQGWQRRSLPSPVLVLGEVDAAGAQHLVGSIGIAIEVVKITLAEGPGHIVAAGRQAGQDREGGEESARLPPSRVVHSAAGQRLQQQNTAQAATGSRQQSTHVMPLQGSCTRSATRLLAVVSLVLP